jgi:hypothetical protein
MNNFSAIAAQNHWESYVGAGCYLSVDGDVKSCRTAPLLELPVDFLQWLEPTPAKNAPMSLN